MQKTLQIVFIFVTFAFSGVRAQNAYLYIIPSSVQIQVQGKAGELVPFYYRVVYHADVSTKEPFSGWVRTFYTSNYNSLPGKSEDSASTADNVFGGGPLLDGDTMGVYGHIRIDANYFRNGNNNFIVIWPTGGRSSNKQEVHCIDSVKVPKNILITGLTGINDPGQAGGFVKIYPNPASTFIRLEPREQNLQIRSIRLYDIMGKEILSLPALPEVIDISSFHSGTYFLEIICNDFRIARYPILISR